MSRQELKIAIKEMLEKTPDTVLNEVLNYLNAVQNKSNKTLSLLRDLRTILSEDKELLERLAK